MLKVLTVFGTRPEAIKMAPLIAELESHPGVIDNRSCLTGQHKDMVAPLIDLFNIRVDHDLKLMRENQTLEHITVSVLQEIGKILRHKRPETTSIYAKVDLDALWGLAQPWPGGRS